MLSKALLGFAAATGGFGAGPRFYAPAPPLVQPAVQPTAGIAYPRPVVVDALPQPVLVEAAPQSGASFGLLACVPFGFLGYALAKYATKPPAGNAGPIAMAAVSGRGRPAPKRAAPKRVVKKSAPKPTPKKPSAFGRTVIQSGDIGTTKPLGVYDPLELMNKMPDKYRRYQEMEIKHGRFAMAACLHVFVTEAGFRWPGYLSIAEDIKFSDMPGGTIASWEALPNLAWAQIVLIVALLDNSVLAQDPNKNPGDIAGDFWVRYEDKPGTSGKEFKLNAERNNGRAAMMGITGMIIHEALTGNPLFPIPIGEQPILTETLTDIEKGPARVGSFVLVALGMAACGAAAAIPEFGKQDRIAVSRGR
jgi:light-harvesting complex I chlorophyll a/b binding protein 1